MISRMNVGRPQPSRLSSPEARAASPAHTIAPAPAGHRIPKILLVGLGGFFVAISWQVVIPVLPLHLSKIGYTASEIGTLVSLLSLAMGLVEMQVGRIVGGFGRRHTLLWGLVANAVCMVLLAYARIAATVSSSLAAVGVTRAVLWPPLHATVADTASEETRGQAFGVFWFWTSVAFLTGPAIGGIIAARFGDRAAFYLGGLFSLLALPVVIAVTEPGRPRPGMTVGGAGEVLKDAIFFRLCLVNHLYYSMAGIWMTFLPLYMAMKGLSVEVVGWVLTVQGLTYALVQLPTGRLADRWGPHWLILPGVIGRAVIGLLVPIFNLNSPAAFIVAGGLYGLAGGMIPVTFTTLVSRMVPQHRYTTAMGVYNSSGDLGFFIGPLIGGAAALLGIWAPFFLSIPLGLAAVLIGVGGVAAAERSEAAADASA